MSGIGEPAPMTTVCDNTATFRARETSLYNPFDCNDVEHNSLNFPNQSRDSPNTKQKRQNCDRHQQSSLDIEPSLHTNQNPSHLMNKQKHISL